MLMVNQMAGFGEGWDHPGDLDYIYYSKNFNQVAQDGATFGCAFNPAGTTMFVLGINNNTIYQYTLSTGYEVDTSTYATLSLSVAAQTITPKGIALSADGTKLYVLNGAGQSILQYTLPTPYSLSGAINASLSANLAVQTSNCLSFAFSNDGTKMFAVDAGTGEGVFQYTLSTAWNISTASYASKSFSLTGIAIEASGIVFSADGARMYVMDYTANGGTGTIYEFTLPVEFDLGVVQRTNKKFNYATGTGALGIGLACSADRSRFYVTGNLLYQFNTI